MRLTASVAIILAFLIPAASLTAAPILGHEDEAGLGMPLDSFERISSPYGWRIHPILRRPEFHKGVDFAAPAGTPVMASAAGTIELAGRRGNYGHYVRLRHEGGLGTGYAHLARIRPGLHVGSTVERGEVIGFVGASGLATGPHLYYEVFRDGDWVDPRTAGLPLDASCCTEADASLLLSPKRPARAHPTHLAFRERRPEAPRAVEPPQVERQPASWRSPTTARARYRLVVVATPEEARRMAAEAGPAWQRAPHPEHPGRGDG